jgi:hypothetical protein
LEGAGRRSAPGKGSGIEACGQVLGAASVLRRRNVDVDDISVAVEEARDGDLEAASVVVADWVAGVEWCVLEHSTDSAAARPELRRGPGRSRT